MSQEENIIKSKKEITSTQLQQSFYRFTDKSASYRGIKQYHEKLDLNLDKNEVLIKIKAVSLNYRDFAVASGKCPLLVKNNVIPDSDADVEVIQIDSGVSDLVVGDRVIINFDPENLYGPQTSHLTAFDSPQDGALTQYMVLPSYAINKLPKVSHLTDEEAAVLVCTGVTAWNSLYGFGDRFVAGQTVLMLGTGGVSITTLILAKAAGAVTIITSSSDEKFKYVQEKWCVDYTINYKTYLTGRRRFWKLPKSFIS